MYKFRTMIVGADKEQAEYLDLNEADGPVFKIREDPRFTKIGKLLSHTGLDELPQVFNVLIGDMNFIGPRPLPVYEAEKIQLKYKAREKVKPGIVSPWLFAGYHQLKFSEWMESDLEYLKIRSYSYDFSLILKAVMLFIGLVCGEIKERLKSLFC